MAKFSPFSRSHADQASAAARDGDSDGAYRHATEIARNGTSDDVAALVEGLIEAAKNHRNR